MSRLKITVTEIGNQPQTGSAIEIADGPKSLVVFEQTFDDLDLREFVRNLNAAPRRRRKTKADQA